MCFCRRRSDRSEQSSAGRPANLRAWRAKMVALCFACVLSASRMHHAEAIELQAAHVNATACLLARAFEIDPAYRYLFPDPAERERGLCDFFARNLRTHLPYGCTHAFLDGRNTPFATVTLRPPAGITISTLTMLRRGLLPFALAHGRGAVRRLFWLKRVYDELEAAAADGAPHFYVHMMAVAPEQQGQGHGALLLDRMLATNTAGAPTVPIVLTTHLPRNVAFYRRAGFRVVGERMLQPPDAAAYTVWSMRRG
jgi:ribosomal protein S18 acetylase RimI-like enzyme